LIELAEYTMKRGKHPRPLVTPSKPLANTSAQDKPTMASLHQQADDQMNGDIAKAFADFNRNYLPQYPAFLASIKSSVSAKKAMSRFPLKVNGELASSLTQGAPPGQAGLGEKGNAVRERG
jgi:hypothetical protein